MADFVADTAVVRDEHEPGLVHASLTERWSVWGPNGGHLAATALRAGLACSRFDRPASFHCHFLAVGGFEPVEIHVRAVGGGRRAESLQLEVHQRERLLLTGVLWTIDEELSGFDHAIHSAPIVPRPTELAPFHQLADNYEEWFPIWRSMEGCPVKWRTEPGEPISQTWLRFNDTPIEGREADAVRQLFWMDFPGWNATISAHAWPFRFIAPNLDLTVQFHGFAPEADWMLADGVAPVARDGIVCTQSRIWTEDGRLVASGSSSHIFRPNPNYEQDLEMARAQGLMPEDAG